MVELSSTELKALTERDDIPLKQRILATQLFSKSDRFGLLKQALGDDFTGMPKGYAGVLADMSQDQVMECLKGLNFDVRAASAACTTTYAELDAYLRRHDLYELIDYLRTKPT